MSKKILGKILMILLPIAILLLAILLVSEIKKKTPERTVFPLWEIPSPTPSKVRLQSRWATDSAVLTIEENLKSLSEELRVVDLKEASLLPPVLDMEVKY